MKGTAIVVAMLMAAIVTVSVVVVSAQMPVTIKGKVTFKDGTGVGKGWIVNVTNLDTGESLGSDDTTIGSEYIVAVDPGKLNVGDTIEAVARNDSWSGRTTHVVQSGENSGGAFIWMNITVSTNMPPNVTVETPSGEQCGDVVINYTLFDADSDTCSIKVEFKGGTHTTWTTATVSGQTTGLTSSPDGVLHSITWLSTLDIPGEDSLFQIRITPSDEETTGEAGVTSDFEVDNKAPTIVFIPPTPDDGAEVAENYVVINVSISDDDVDTVWLCWNKTGDGGGGGGIGIGKEVGNPVLFASGNITESLSTEYIYTFEVTNLTNGEYNYKVFANDTTTCGNLGVSEARSVIINATRIYELSLTEGWNLISIPLEIENTSINAVFPDANDGDMIYGYEDGVWYVSTYYSDYGVWDGDVMTIQPDKGYWYVAKSAYNATIEGTEAGQRSVQISAGWNLIGYTRLSEASLNDLITEEDGCSDGDMIYGYEDGVWYVSTYYSDYGVWDGDVTVMKPGRGYWYVAKSPFTWVY